METEGAGIEFNNEKHLLSKEEKERIVFDVKTKITLVTNKLNELMHDIDRLYVDKKNSENFIAALNRNNDGTIGEMKNLICELEKLKDTLRDLETEKF